MGVRHQYTDDRLVDEETVREKNFLSDVAKKVFHCNGRISSLLCRVGDESLRGQTSFQHPLQGCQFPRRVPSEADHRRIIEIRY